MEQNFTLQDLIRRRQASGFVGRSDELSAFETTLHLPVEDPRRRFLFSVHGDAGVGKTFLLKQFIRLAAEQSYLTAYVDETALDVPSILSAFTEDLERQGVRCKELLEKLELYRKRRGELDVDPAAPEGLPVFLTRSTVRVGLRAVGEIPIVGAFTEEIDPDAASEQAERLRAYLSRKFRNHDDVTLMLAPVDILTRAFLKDLFAMAKRHPVALFVDTYERTGGFLDPWLLSLLAGRFGHVPANFILVISGQLPLDANRWGDYLDLRTEVPLRVFSDTEARQLLAARGVTNDHVIDVILSLSGRLPLLLAMLAEGRPRGPHEVGDPSGSAVERFLKWEPAPSRRAAALHGAFPRRLNEDILILVTGSDNAGNDFEWLRKLPFVVEHSDGYRYHEVVRSQMLRVSRRRLPADWRQIHKQLVDHFRAERDVLQLQGRLAFKNGTWQSLAIEENYHRICHHGVSALPTALGGLLDSVAWRSQDVRRWTQMLEQAGRDADLEEVTSYAKRLIQLEKEGKDEHAALVEELVNESSLSAHDLATAYAERAAFRSDNEQQEDALSDFDRAVVLNPSASWIYVGRGFVYHQLERFGDALVDFNRAVELDPDYDVAISGRGETYRLMGSYEQALVDLSRAVEMDAKDAWSVASRGQTYQAMEKYDEALLDFERAYRVDPKYVWTVVARGHIYRSIGQYDNALIEFNRVIEADPENDVAIASRGDTLNAMGRHTEALRDFDRAIELDPNYDVAVAGRAETYQDLEQYDKALEDFSRAVELDPDYKWARVGRAQVYQAMGRTGEALADLAKVIALDPHYKWAFVNRGQVHRLEEKHEEAIVDFTRAIALDAKYDLAMACRGDSYYALGRHEEALVDLSEALRLDPDYKWAAATRGDVYQSMGRYLEALADYSRAVEIDPTFDSAHARRGEIYRVLGRHEDAFADFDRAIELDPKYGWARAKRAELYRTVGRYDEALAEFSSVLEVDAENAPFLVGRARTLQLVGRFDEALQDFARALQAEPEYDYAYTYRGDAYRVMGRYDEALADYARAVELDSTDAWSVYRRGLVMLLQGDHQAARALFEKAVQVERAGLEDLQFAGNTWGFNVAVYLAALGDLDAAKEQALTMLGRGPARGQVQEFASDLEELQQIAGVSVGEILRLARGHLDA